LGEATLGFTYLSDWIGFVKDEWIFRMDFPFKLILWAL
jgi:hypothetical protein